MRKPVDIGKVLLIGLIIVVVVGVIICFETFTRIKLEEGEPAENLISDSNYWKENHSSEPEEEEEAVSSETISEEAPEDVSKENVPEDLPPELAEINMGSEFVTVPEETLKEIYHFFDDAPAFKSTDELTFQKIMDAYFWCNGDFKDGKYRLTAFDGDSVAIHHAIQDPFRDPEDEDFRYVAGPNFNYKVSLEELNQFAREFFGSKVKEITAAAVPDKIYGTTVKARSADARIYYYNGSFYMNVTNKAKNSENRYFIASANDAGKKIELIVFYVKPKMDPKNEGKDHFELQEVYQNSMIDGYIRKKITLAQGYSDAWYITSSRTMSRYKM